MGYTPSEEEIRTSRSISGCAATGLRDDPIKISIEGTCTDSLVTAPGGSDPTFFNDYITNDVMFLEEGQTEGGQYCSGNIDSGGSASKEGCDGKDDTSLYGTPKEEMDPLMDDAKPSFIRHQLEALFQPTDNKLAMKLFGSKKALMKERIRQKAAGHWIIHPCSNFR